MKHIIFTAAAAMLVASASLQAYAQDEIDSILLPTRTVIITGNPNGNGTLEMIGKYYSTENTYFNDPGAPRFLLLDREGKIALGIGGQIYGTLNYDFGGSIDDGSSFTTYEIPVPNNVASRSRFYGDASQSSLFLKMIGRTSRFGYFTGYLQTAFDAGSYRLRLKHAYLTLGNVLAGLTNSVFVDPGACPPTIDPEGPSGISSARNVMLRYNPHIGKNVSVAISIENPSISQTVNASTQAATNKMPDIPAYVQYAWDKGRSHVRLSAIARGLFYRNALTNEEHTVMGYGVQLSGFVTLPAAFKVYYNAVYGRGIARYMNDLGGDNLDLIYSTEAGKMLAPKSLGLTGGLSYSVTPKLLLSANYSLCRLYDQRQLGGDTYRRAQYATGNIFYNIIDDLQVGVEYLWGQRKNEDGQTGHANSIMALLKFEF